MYSLYFIVAFIMRFNCVTFVVLKERKKATHSNSFSYKQEEANKNKYYSSHLTSIFIYFLHNIRSMLVPPIALEVW